MRVNFFQKPIIAFPLLKKNDEWGCHAIYIEKKNAFAQENDFDRTWTTKKLSQSKNKHLNPKFMNSVDLLGTPYFNKKEACTSNRKQESASKKLKN